MMMAVQFCANVVNTFLKKRYRMLLLLIIQWQRKKPKELMMNEPGTKKERV